MFLEIQKNALVWRLTIWRFCNVFFKILRKQWVDVMKMAKITPKCLYTPAPVPLGVANEALRCIISILITKHIPTKFLRNESYRTWSKWMHMMCFCLRNPNLGSSTVKNSRNGPWMSIFTIFFSFLTFF